MNFYVDNETDYKFDFDTDEIVSLVCRKVLEREKCPFENISVNVLITDNEGIRDYNSKFRNIDKETDVLSFPNLEFETPGDYYIPEGEEADYIDPESGDIVLGDIILSKDRIISQAEEYGHSIKREFAFLVAHSMLHLSGYDHMTEDEAKEMEERQKAVLDELGITRDIK
ncbi:MAG: rRNA maturation RNase YbeY [Lachnospiraceae bacterium]|nr:rRNA maturation RNase YbeY [Lachnospiraceae bacterium]